MTSIAVFTTLFLLSSDSHAFSFVKHQSLSHRLSSSSTSTELYMISSWGVKGNPAFRTKERLDPERNIQDYLPEPGPVEARSNIDGTILVSGLVNHKDRTDQFLFDLINHEDSAFEFKNITAFVDDATFAKKRLLSRSARYTGLLDKLHLIQASEPGALPKVEDLQNVKSWLAILENKDGNNNQLIQHCKDISELAMLAAKSATGDVKLENVAIVLAGINELSTDACKSAVEAVAKLSDVNVQYTVVAVGNLDDTRVEGSAAYQYEKLNEMEQVLPAKATFSREEMYRIVTELLQLECGVNQAFVFAEVYNPNITEAKLIKGLREAGYARPQEIDHMIRNGPAVRETSFPWLRTFHRISFFSIGFSHLYLFSHNSTPFSQFRRTRKQLRSSVPKIRMRRWVTLPTHGGKPKNINCRVSAVMNGLPQPLRR